MPGRFLAVVPIGLLLLGLSGCASTEAASPSPRRAPAAKATTAATDDQLEESASPSRPAPRPSVSASADASATGVPDAASPPARAPRMLRATMRIPEIRIRSLPVVPYRGSPDDGPGTRIQNGGVAASPFGAGGGVGPGQVGNYIVTAHRTTSPAPFAELPSLRRGDHVLVRTRARVLDYRLTRTRWTSFRSRRSLARQAAAVPGHPGMPATRPMITLSTCATPEDHARGNYWADEFGNPEHRIDKIGVLVDVRPVGSRRSRASDGPG